MRDYYLIVIGLLYCGLGASLALVSVLLITRKLNEYNDFKHKKLPDLLLSTLPEYVSSFQFTENSIIIMMALNIILISVHNKKCLILKRIFVIFGSVYVLRFLTLMTTIFPIPNDPSTCPTEKYDKRGFVGLLHDLVGMLFTFGLMNSGMVSCGDSMFSGHTATLIILAGNFSHYLPKRLYILQYIIWTWAIVGIFCVLASHMHYTMDVIVGIWISRHVFTMYYQIVFVQEIHNASHNVDNTLQYPIADDGLSNNNEHTIIISNDDASLQILTSDYLSQAFGLFFWLNPIFVYFEKYATFQENIITYPIVIDQSITYLRRRLNNLKFWCTNQHLRRNPNIQLL